MTQCQNMSVRLSWIASTEYSNIKGAHRMVRPWLYWNRNLYCERHEYYVQVSYILSDKNSDKSDNCAIWIFLQEVLRFPVINRFPVFMRSYDVLSFGVIFLYSYTLSYTLSDKLNLIHSIEKRLKGVVGIVLCDIGWLVSDNGLDDPVINLCFSH